MSDLLPRSVVHFHPPECEFIIDLASRRNGIKVAYGIQRNGTYDGLSDTRDMHVLNTFGEFAVARVLGGEVDEQIVVAGKRRGNVILGARRGQVIARSRRGSGEGDFALKSTNVRDFYADFGFLVWPVREYHGSGHTVQVMGWISREEFIAVSEQKRLKGMRLLVTLSQMHRMTEHLHAPVAQGVQATLFD